MRTQVRNAVGLSLAIVGVVASPLRSDTVFREDLTHPHCRVVSYAQPKGAVCSFMASQPCADRSAVNAINCSGPTAVNATLAGRQLFVDDALVERLDGLERRYHYPVKYAGNPVLKAETQFEIPEPPLNKVTLPKGGGMWWDEKDGVFKLWYEVGWCGTIHYATSPDGISWTRPAIDPKTGDNKIVPSGGVDSWSVVKDPHCTDPQALYKLYVQPGGQNTHGYASVSADGIHWTPWQKTGKSGDRSTMFYNPFTREWVFSLRSAWHGRTRNYYACRDFLKESTWEWVDMRTPSTNCVKWLDTDDLDKPDPVVGERPQLYSFDAVAYESIMLGVFEIHRGPDNLVCAERGLPKITDLEFAYSRDGFKWNRPDRTAAIRSERWGSGKWDTGYVQPLSNLCVIMGDKLRFYYGAFAGNEEKKWVRGTQRVSARNGMYDNGAMGFAELRRDGFVSLHADGEGVLTTRPLVFNGEWMFVNADCPNGELRVEAQDAQGRVIAPFSFENCMPVSADSTKAAVKWKGSESLAQIRGREVRFRFRLRSGDMYAFWVSAWRTGESGGYLAGGGPGHAGLIDRP